MHNNVAAPHTSPGVDGQRHRTRGLSLGYVGNRPPAYSLNNVLVAHSYVRHQALLENVWSILTS